MSKRTGMLLNSLSAAMQRVMRAMELHTHPDLAKANHGHTDLASREDLNDLSRHYIPGSKRQCVRYAIENTITYNAEKIIDPSFTPGATTFNFASLVHFNAAGSGGSYDDVINGAIDWYTNGSLQTGGLLNNNSGVAGVTVSNRIYLPDSKKSLTRWISQVGNYSNYAHWSESFVWEPLSGKAIDTRYIFRTTCPTSSSWSGDNSSGFFLYIQANSYKVALRLRLADLSVATLYIEDFDHISPSDTNSGDSFPPGTKYAIEILYVGGAYKVYVNGVYKRLYDHTNRTITDRIDIGDDLGWNVNKNTVIMGTSYTATPNKGFGGNSQGARGYFDEYSFKVITDPVNYDPTKYTWNGTTGNITDSPITAGFENDPNATPSAPLIGAEKRITINEDNFPLALSASNFLSDYTDVFDKVVIMENLPINNRSFIYALYEKIEGRIVKSLAHTLIPFHYFDRYFKPKYWAGLWFSKNTPASGADFALPNDFYGVTWESTEVDDDVSPSTGTQYQIGSTDIPGGYTTSWAKLITSSDYMKSKVDSLADRWTIRLYYQRMSTNTGVLFQTTDAAAAAAPGIKVLFVSDSIHVYISADGNSWVGATDHVVINSASTNSAPGDYFAAATEFFDAVKNAGRTKSAVAIEIFYTGFKYGIRLGLADATGGDFHNAEWLYWQWLDFDWEDAYDGIVMPIKFDPGSTSIYDDEATLTIGDSAGAGIAGMRVHAFQVFPYVAMDDVIFGNRQFNFDINETNYQDFIDHRICWFDKSSMMTMVYNSGNRDFSAPNFINGNKSMVMLGYADSDQGGVVNALNYTNNARFESEWIQVTLNKEYNFSHRIGNKDLSPTIYLNKRPTLDGAFISNNVGYGSGGGGSSPVGTWVKDITDDTLLVATGSNHVYSNENGSYSDKLYMKVVVERNW